jgi:hypothetical protein
MSFTTLKIAELRQIAEDFAVDLPNSKNKAEIVAALAEEGVTWDVYQKTIKNIEDEAVEMEEVLPKFDPKKEQPENTVLVKMTRANFRYDTLGFTFTKEHPFVAMPSEKAEEIFEKEEGFRLATATEVQDFYA